MVQNTEVGLLNLHIASNAAIKGLCLDTRQLPMAAVMLTRNFVDNTQSISTDTGIDGFLVEFAI